MHSLANGPEVQSLSLSLSLVVCVHVRTHIAHDIMLSIYVAPSLKDHLPLFLKVTKPLLETSRRGYLAAISASSYSFVSLLQHFLPIMNPGNAHVFTTMLSLLQLYSTLTFFKMLFYSRMNPAFPACCLVVVLFVH